VFYLQDPPLPSTRAPYIPSTRANDLRMAAVSSSRGLALGDLHLHPLTCGFPRCRFEESTPPRMHPLGGHFGHPRCRRDPPLLAAPELLRPEVLLLVGAGVGWPGRGTGAPLCQPRRSSTYLRPAVPHLLLYHQ
jgi:hypothetical protein